MPKRKWGKSTSSKRFQHLANKGKSNGITNANVNPLQSQREGLVNGNVLQNGMTNGLGGPQGLTNGNGMINGTGLVNGNGMVNGIGLVNGNGPGFTNGTLRTPSLRSNENAISPKRTSFVMLIVYMLIVVSVFAVLTYDDEPGYEGPRVDGDFSDWDDVQLYSDTGGSSIPSLDVVEYGLNPTQNKLFLYARAQESWMSSGNIDRLLIFIDGDDDDATGYQLEDIGADYLIEVYGWNGNIQGKVFNVFNGQDQDNWSAWGTSSGVSAALNGAQIEISAPSSQISLGATNRLLFLTMREGSVEEVCQAQISDGQGSLVVTQTPSDINGIISSNDVLQVKLQAVGTDVTVDAITFETTGVVSASVTGLPVTISAGSSTTLPVTAPVDATASGTFAGVDVSSISCDGIVNIVGEGLKAYAHAAPVNISVDGAFADWGPVGKSSDTVGEIENPNVDITEYASANTTSHAYFYLKVNPNGEMFAGGIVPQAREKPGPPGEPGEPGEPQEPTPLPKKTGEDITRIYVDTVDGGQNIGGLRADYLIEIKGFQGEITSKNLYSLPGKHLVKTIDAANGVRELEVGTTLTDIEYNGSLQLFFETTDWMKNEDTTPVIISMTRSLSFGTRSGGAPPEITGTADLMDAPYTTKTIGVDLFIDGDWSAAEWVDADYYDPGDSTIIVYTMQDSTNLYVAVRVIADGTYSASDYCALFFDTEQPHPDPQTDTTPQTDDRQFNATDPDGSATLADYAGDGSVWIAGSAAAWDADGAVDVSEIVYEFQIPFIEVWGTATPSSGDIAGFAVHVYDADGPSDYYWGSTDVSDTDPSTWDDLQIPEFPTFLIPILVMLFVPILMRKEPRESEEQ